MRHPATLAICWLLLLLVLHPASAEEATCALHVEDEPTSNVFAFRDHLASCWRVRGMAYSVMNGAAQFAEDEPTGEVLACHDAPGGLLLNTENGLLRHDGTGTFRVGGEPTGYVRWHTRDPCGGEVTCGVTNFHTPDGLLLSAEKRPVSLRKCGRGIRLLGPEIPFILQPFRASEQVWIDRRRTDCGADHPHGTA